MNENHTDPQNAQCDVQQGQTYSDGSRTKAGYGLSGAPPVTVRMAIKDRIEQHLRRAAELQQLMDVTDRRVLEHTVGAFHRVSDAICSPPF